MAVAIQSAAAGLGALAAVGAWLRLRPSREHRRRAATRQPNGRVAVATRDELRDCPRWQRAFASHRKDARYYDVVERTIDQGFEYRYFVVEDSSGQVRAVQPFFLLDQDLLAGGGQSITRFASGIRKIFPRFLVLRTLMVGCAAGEGQGIDGPRRGGQGEAEERRGGQLARGATLSPGGPGAPRGQGRGGR